MRKDWGTNSGSEDPSPNDSELFNDDAGLILGNLVKTDYEELVSALMINLGRQGFYDFQSSEWSIGSLQIIGTASLMLFLVFFVHCRKCSVHKWQTICGAQLLSWSLKLKPKYTKYALRLGDISKILVSCIFTTNIFGSFTQFLFVADVLSVSNNRDQLRITFLDSSSTCTDSCPANRLCGVQQGGSHYTRQTNWKMFLFF